MPYPKPTLHPQTLIKPTGETFTFNMVEVEGGTFMMGCQPERDGEDGHLDRSKPLHGVRLESFLAAEVPLTQALYEFVMGKNPSHFLGKHRAVQQVSWYDTVEFCNQLSLLAGWGVCYQLDKEKKDPNNQQEVDSKKWLAQWDRAANGYRLPTEAEWEYMARGGRHWADACRYAGGDDLHQVGWYQVNSHQESPPVGLKTPNQLGLYDLSGNTWEWCWDWYGEDFYQESPTENPTGPDSGQFRVIRGGSWTDGPLNTRIANRNRRPPNLKSTNNGFRVVRSHS